MEENERQLNIKYSAQVMLIIFSFINIIIPDMWLKILTLMLIILISLFLGTLIKD